MVVIFVGMIGTLGFNINAGILQGLGDSRTSLLFLSIAAGINIVLDLVFTLCGMGVFGVAFATIIAQIASWLFGVYFINRHYTFLHIQLFKIQFQRSLFKKAIQLGIPSGIQQALFAVGIMAMQALVNSYGSTLPPDSTVPIRSTPSCFSPSRACPALSPPTSGKMSARPAWSVFAAVPAPV